MRVQRERETRGGRDASSRDGMVKDNRRTRTVLYTVVRTRTHGITVRALVVYEHREGEHGSRRTTATRRASRFLSLVPRARLGEIEISMRNADSGDYPIAGLGRKRDGGRRAGTSENRRVKIRARPRERADDARRSGVGSVPLFRFLRSTIAEPAAPSRSSQSRKKRFIRIGEFGKFRSSTFI